MARLSREILGGDQLTELEPNAQRLKSQFGEGTYLEWCMREAERINRSRGQNSARTYLNGGRQCCVVINRRTAS